MFQFQTWEIEFDTAGESFEAAMGAISRLVDVLGKDGFRVDQLARVRGDIVDAFSPLAEEPDYRHKIIFTMPQIHVLDRHRVTLAERQKAEALMLAQGMKKKPAKKAAAVDKDPRKGFSKGEKDLYAEVG